MHIVLFGSAIIIKISESRIPVIVTAQKMKFSFKDFFSKCAQFLADLLTFTEEILNGKLHFLCSECNSGTGSKR